MFTRTACDENHLSEHWCKYREFPLRLYYGLADLEARVIPSDLCSQEGLVIQALRPYRVFQASLFDLLVLVLQGLLFRLANCSFGKLKFIYLYYIKLFGFFILNKMHTMPGTPGGPLGPSRPGLPMLPKLLLAVKPGKPGGPGGPIGPGRPGRPGLPSNPGTPGSPGEPIEP